MSMELALPEEFNIYAAAQQHSRLLGCLDGLHEGGLTLRTDTVAEVDAAGIQLLVSLAHECRARGLWLKLGGISPALDAALRVTGLAPFFTHAATAMEVAP